MGVFAILIWLLSLISMAVSDDVSDETGNAEKKDDTATELKNNTRYKGFAAIQDAIDSYHQSRKADGHKQNKREKIGIVLVGATAVFALLATVAAGVSAIIFQGQLNSMEADQRPWIGITGIEAREWPIHTKDRATYKLTFDLKNLGKSPAQVLVRAAVIITDGKTMDAWEAQKEACKHPLQNENLKWIVLPNDRFLYDVEPVLKADFTAGKKYTPGVVGCVLYKLPSKEDHAKPFITSFVATMSLEAPWEDLPRETYIPISSDQIFPADRLRIKNILVAGDLN